MGKNMFKKLALTMLICAPLLAVAAGAAKKAATPDAAPPAPASDQVWPEAGKYPVPAAPDSATLRSVSLDDLLQRDLLPLGIYKGTPELAAKRAWLDQNFYATLAARKVWHTGTGPSTHEFQGPITWDIVPIPQPAPPPCDKPQPTGYDAESCRYVNSLFKDVKDPAKAKALREQVRKGRDVWFKGTFGNQDEQSLHFSRTTPNGISDIYYPWLDTRERSKRFTKFGVINDPDCTEGDASTNYWDKCPDPHSSGVLGYRKYFADPTKDDSGKVVFDPATSPYEKDELKKNKRFIIGHPCVQCHVAFDPTNPPADPNKPKWENINALIGNQYINQPTMF